MVIAGAITVILTWGFKVSTGVAVPVEVGQALTLLIGFIGAHFGSERGRKRDNGYKQ